MGVWYEEGKDWIKTTSAKLKYKSCDVNVKSKDYLSQRKSYLMQMGDAESILCSLPSEERLEDFFYL